MTPAVSLRRRVIAVIALAAIVLIALVTLWPRADATPSGHTHGVSTPEPDVVGAAADGIPLDPPGEDGDGVGNAPETSLAAAGAAAPETRDVDSLGVEREAIDPADVLAEGSDTLGGCLAAYGESGQCLTAVPPSQGPHVQEMVDAGIDPSTMTHEWTCAELRTYFPDGIAVREPGVDPSHLDSDGDGVACGPDD